MWSAARSWTVLMSICWSSPAASRPRTFEVPPLPLMQHLEPELRDPRADLGVERRDHRVLVDHDALGADAPGAVAEQLQAGVANPGGLRGANLGDPAVPARSRRPARRSPPAASRCDPSSATTSETGWKATSARGTAWRATSGPVDDDAAGHVAEESPGPGRLRQRPEVSVGCRPVLLPEEALARARGARARRCAGRSG